MADSFDEAVAERYIKQAYPHESGHILVGRLLGLKVSGLKHEIIRGRNNEILPGNFITGWQAQRSQLYPPIGPWAPYISPSRQSICVLTPA